MGPSRSSNLGTRSRRHDRPRTSWRALGASILLALLGAAYAACPAPDFALTSEVAERFQTYLQTYFPQVGDRSLSLHDRFVLVGYGLGRQAPAVGDDPARRDAFDCLMVAVDQRTFWSRVLEGRNLDALDAQRAFRTMYAAAMGMHDDRVAELTGYDASTRLPTVFDDPASWAPAAAAASSSASGSDPAPPAPPSAIDVAEVDGYRDAVLARGLGPERGPGGATCPLDREIDVRFHQFASATPCWEIDGALWCCSQYRWWSVAAIGSDEWSMALLDGSPSCEYATHWQRTWDAGEPAFGGEAECPGREEVSPFYVLDYR